MGFKFSPGKTTYQKENGSSKSDIVSEWSVETNQSLKCC